MIIELLYTLSPAGQLVAARAGAPAARAGSLALAEDTADAGLFALAFSLARVDTTGRVQVQSVRDYDAPPTAAEVLYDVQAARAARAAYLADRAEWIVRHGSAHLRRCAAEGVESDRFYRNERLALDLPRWSWLPVSVTLREPRNPSPEAFAMLERARADAPAALLHYVAGEYVAVTVYLGHLAVYAGDRSAKDYFNAHRESDGQ